MKLRNNINQRLKIKIKKCIELLDEEYRELNYTLDFYPERERLEFERDNKPDMETKSYYQILNGENVVGGVTLKNIKRIKVFVFNYSKLETNPNEVLAFIGNIYHEIRHAWQIEKELFTEEIEVETIDDNKEDYFNLAGEKDAYRFQLEKMKLYANKILGIFEINATVRDYKLKEPLMKFIDE